MIDDAALLEKYRELDRESAAILMAIFDTKGHDIEQRRHLATYKALDKRIQVIMRKLGCDDLADNRAASMIRWCVYMGFEKKQSQYQQETFMKAS